MGNNLAVAWFSSPDKKAQVNIIFSNDGGASFNAPVRIDEGKGIGRVDLVMLDDKSAMVSWMEGAVIKAVKVYKDGKKRSCYNNRFLGRIEVKWISPDDKIWQQFSFCMDG